MKFRLTVFMMLLVGGILGCSRQPSLEQAQADVCRNLATFRQDLATLAAVSQNSTVGQLKDAQASVNRSFQDLKASVDVVRSIKIDELEQAYQELDQTIGNISDNQTIQEAIATVQPAMQNVQSASEQFRTGAACQ